MKTKELHAMSMTDLQKKLKDFRQELFNLRFQMATGQLANHRQIRHVRQSLAQILTEIHLKEMDQTVNPPAEAPVEAPKRRRKPVAEATT
jgi:large subunit ribosomal protein L29